MDSITIVLPPSSLISQCHRFPVFFSSPAVCVSNPFPYLLFSAFFSYWNTLPPYTSLHHSFSVLGVLFVFTLSYIYIPPIIKSLCLSFFDSRFCFGLVSLSALCVYCTVHSFSCLLMLRTSGLFSPYIHSLKSISLFIPVSSAFHRAPTYQLSITNYSVLSADYHCRVLFVSSEPIATWLTYSSPVTSLIPLSVPRRDFFILFIPSVFSNPNPFSVLSFVYVLYSGTGIT